MKPKIKLDSGNYRKHNDRNKRIINKSLKELGTGRSILIDGNNEIIAGNATYQEAEKLKIPVKIIETDGNELIAIKRKDLKPGDKKRKELALIDNHASDTSEFDYALIEDDFDKVELDEWEVMEETGFDEPFKPFLEPETSENKITQEEIENRAKELAKQFIKESKNIDVICPECGHEFTVK